HRDVQQEWVWLVAPEALDEHAGSPGRVDHYSDPHRPGDAVVREAKRDAVAVERGVDQPMLLEHARAALLRVAEQDIVELLAQNLKGLRSRRLTRELEIRVALIRAVRPPEAGAPLFDEARRGDRVAQAEPAENLVGPRQLRFADVEARESLALQDDHAPAALRQRGGGGGAARPPADHRYVVVPPVSRAGHDPPEMVRASMR